ncbi:hypothetical protein ABIB35_002496 [Arthrobacter sp. UYP6]|uniref:HAAS signaling domain-containing protein n=1 Tax=Arthrobacter sp. UYP6 TaxID=1756378 RepID=UPI003397E62C
MNNADAGTHPGYSGHEDITAHPLVRSYLDDLDRSLAGAEDRSDVLNAVTEHITEAAGALPGPATTAQVREVLAGLGPVERIAAASGTEPEAAERAERAERAEFPPQATAVRPGPERPWLGTPSGIIALTALVLSIVLIPLFFPLAALSLVLAIIGLVRRRPRPRSAWVITIISGVLLVVVLAIGILASLFLFATETGSGSPQPATTSVSVPAEEP